MSGLSLAELVGGPADRAAHVEPASAAVVTYADLAESVDAVARQLLGAGILPGDRIALWGENGPEVIVAFLAVARASAVAMPINPALTATEISAMLAELRPRALIMDADETRRDLRSVCATMAEICAHGPSRDTAIRVMTETMQVGNTLGCHPKLSVEQRLAGAAQVGEHKTSMLQDLEAGKPLELAALVTAVVELADLVGEPAPSLRTLHGAAELMERARARPAVTAGRL